MSDLSLENILSSLDMTPYIDVVYRYAENDGCYLLITVALKEVFMQQRVFHNKINANALFMLTVRLTGNLH